MVNRNQCKKQSLCFSLAVDCWVNQHWSTAFLIDPDTNLARCLTRHYINSHPALIVLVNGLTWWLMHWLTGNTGMGMGQCWGSQSLLWWTITVRTSPGLSLVLLRKTAVTVNLHKGGLLKTWLLIKLSHSKSHLVLWGVLSPFSYKADCALLFWGRKKL